MSTHSTTTPLRSDIEIAQRAKLRPIREIARDAGLLEEELEQYGNYKGKIDLSLLDRLQDKPDGKLILVTAMNPTTAGEGKTTVSVGLAQALKQIGKKAVLALREPSLGPVFGMKGGATGGGYSQVVPMEDINLHFTGDMHAITAANNLLSAMIDNHIYHGNQLQIDPRKVIWKRVMDMNDRALRSIMIGLGGITGGMPREEGVDITVASEVMAILCLAQGIDDLKRMLGDILIGYSYANEPIYARQLGAEAAMTILLKEAIKPNLVQSLEHVPTIIHGGPFANIAHGCNSLLATRMALKLGDYAITEAGFGADLGAEKFLNIKCRKGGLAPSAVVVVATVRAMKLHGGVNKDELGNENLEAMRAGFRNVEKHVETIRSFGLPVVVALNQFYTDTEAELALFRHLCEQQDLPCAAARIWEYGGQGGEELARIVAETAEGAGSSFTPLYPTDMGIADKINRIAAKVYGAERVIFSDTAQRQIRRFEEAGWGRLPVCMAKTQYSLSDNPKLIGRPSGFAVHVRELRPKLGAGFIVALTGDMLTMPGLPKVPAAARMDIDSNGTITGLS